MVDKITSPVGANDVIKKINNVIDAIPTSTTQLTNDSGFITGITSSMVTTALGYTPYNSTNPAGYISDITSSMVTTALGFTPYNSTNPAGYISGITSSMVTTALGYTPYDASNPEGFISSAALTSLTDTTISNPAAGQGLIYDASSETWKNGNISSSVSWGNITGTLTDQADLNEALGGKQATITGAASSITSSNLTANRALVSNSSGKVAVSSITSTKLGYLTDVTSNIQAQLNGKTTMADVEAKGYITGITSSDVTTALGYTPYNSTNPNGYTSNIGTVTKVNNVSPDASGNVTISIPAAVTESTVLGWGFTKNTGTVTSVNNVQPVNGNVTIAIPTVPTNVSAFNNDAGYITGITSSMVTTALGYTPYNSSNPNGYTSNIGTVTSVNNVAPVNGNVTLPSEVFIAEYDVTSYSDISTAYNAGKAIYCKYTLSSQYFYIPLVQVTSISFIFCGTMFGAETIRISCDRLNWSYERTQLEKVSNKVISISSSSTDTQYPSAKCVYDTLQNALNSKADTDLSNLTATSSPNFDGQFVQKYLQLDNHTSKGSWGYNLGQTDVVVDGTTYSARNYLPDNNYIYVVYGQLEVVSVNDTYYYVGTGKDPYSNYVNMFFAHGRTHSNGNRQENFFCFPIVPNASGYQFIYDQIAVNTASTGARTSLIGYRRVGTNS